MFLLKTQTLKRLGGRLGRLAKIGQRVMVASSVGYSRRVD